MFKVQNRDYTKAKAPWRDARYAPNGNRFATEAAAWAHIESLDEDGVRNTALYRVVRI